MSSFCFYMFLWIVLFLVFPWRCFFFCDFWIFLACFRQSRSCLMSEIVRLLFCKDPCLLPGFDRISIFIDHLRMLRMLSISLFLCFKLLGSSLILAWPVWFLIILYFIIQYSKSPSSCGCVLCLLPVFLVDAGELLEWGMHFDNLKLEGVRGASPPNTQPPLACHVWGVLLLDDDNDCKIVAIL